MLTMYMGDPHNVAAIMLLWRYRAKPKSAGNRADLSVWVQNIIMISSLISENALV